MVKYNKSFDKFIKDSLYFKKMLDFVDSAKNICPVKDKVFRFLELDLKNVKCIILGMDPYKSVYQDGDISIPVATGRAFEVANIEYWTDKHKQVSLTNILKALWNYKYGEIKSVYEIREKINRNKFKFSNIHFWFDDMERQGVMFLNATLTTLEGKSNAHFTIWKEFMDELLKYIVKENNGIKWLIWGRDALNRINGIVPKEDIIYCCHPATRMNNDFVSFCCFKKIKDISWF